MTTPEQHANTVREHLPADYLGPDRNDMDGEKWGQHPEALAALDALVALAARADTLGRERVVERAASVMTETERGVSDEASGTRATLLAEAQIAADEARAEADRLREALEWFAKDGAWIVSSAGINSGRYGFRPPPWGVNSTPWGIARAVLAGPQTKEADLPGRPRGR
jgi:hypothetical protein